MSPNSLRSDCRKFTPNIFNKTKCSNCFKQKEEHTPEALECNRASRKVTKNGYLFVAPNWDFSIPLNRTKRWQRRWFVLYDDGELTYSVDEHPDTVPQACIDMTQVLEVTSAEEVTGHSFSLAITAPDRVTFVKGVSREEARSWTNTLAVYTRNKGRHKRNATFPGGQPTTIHQSEALPRSETPNPIRPRYNSCHSGSSVRSLVQSPSIWKQEKIQMSVSQQSAIPVLPVSISENSTSTINTFSTTLNNRRNSGYQNQPASSASPPTRDKLNSEEKAAVRSRNLSQHGQYQLRTSPNADICSNVSKNLLSEDINQRIIPEYENQIKREEKLKDIAAVLIRPRNLISTNSPTTVQTPTRDSDSTDKEDTSMDLVDSGLNTEIHVELPAEGLLNLKKGWLMQQTDFDTNWCKRWFVLCGNTLTAYRDPDGEDSSTAELVINLSSISTVMEVQVARNYGFQIKLWNDIKYIFSAVTSGIRSNWISAIRKAAGLDDLQPKVINKPPVPNLERNLSNCSVGERDFVRTPSTPRSLLFSSDEEYKTASEGGRRESGDWGESLSALPPSPPLNRTPISRVKERTRSRSSSRNRLYKRSKSSPPSSRTSTLDSVSTEDLMQACCRVTDLEPDLSDPAIIELLEAEVQALRNQLDHSNLHDTLQQQRTHIEELRKKLRNAVNDLNSSEQELARLRQVQAETVIKDRRIEELLLSLKNAEQQLSQQNKQLEDFESFKLICQKDKEELEVKLKEANNLLNEALQKYEMLKSDYLTKQRINDSLQLEMNCLNDRLSRGIEENDFLYKKLQEFDGREQTCLNFGSLSDLTNIDLDLNFENMSKECLIEKYDNLKTRFEKAVYEIKTMKKELRASHVKYDDLELVNITLQQDFKRLEDDHQAQNAMMAARIQDLTAKLTSSEKQVRNLKSKLQDSREKRRSLSLKGRESFSLNKDVEDKITELEAKILALEDPVGNKKALKPLKKSVRRDRSSERSSPVDDRNLRRLRRKSLDSVTSSEPIKVLLKLNSLESKIVNISESTESLVNSSQDSDQNRILILESTLETARQKVNECLDQITILKHSKKSSMSDRISTVEKCLLEVGNILKTVTDYNGISTMEVNVIRESVSCVVKSFETLLKNKLSELAIKRKSLKEAGKFNAENNLNILAEKLAYESVVLSQVQKALLHSYNESSIFSSRILQREILETNELVNVLKNKLNGSIVKKYTCSKVSEEHLTRVLTKKLIQIGYITNNNRKHLQLQQQNGAKLQDITKGLEYLQNKQKDLNYLFKKFKSTKLEQLAYGLALETLNYSPDKQTLDDQVKEAWKIAQETITSELIQNEISHILLKSAQNYESNNKTFFSFFASERAAIELWSDSVDEKFRNEMEKNVQELTTVYKNCLLKLRQQSSGIWRRKVEQERNSIKSKQLLAEFADIIAHKALIDSRISVLTQDKIYPKIVNMSSGNGFIKNLINSEEYLSIMEDCEVLDSDSVLDSEFQYLFQCYVRECESTIDSLNFSQFQQVCDGLHTLEMEINKLQSMSKISDSIDPTIEIKCWNDVGQKCLELKSRLQNIVKVLLRNDGCTQCEILRDSLNRLNQKHETEVAILRRDQERDLVELRGELEHERLSLVTQHQTEQAQLKERARMLELRLGTLDSEYNKQLDQLRVAYRDTLTTNLDVPSGEENLRQRYQAEIEQLRTLCEKGLMVVENSHRRVVAELEEKHRRERDQLRLEKEQALAEETQATLAALDAMRKAHESEVRREVTKFKQDFLRKMQATHDIGALHKEHEVEMQEIKQEILSLSERYSVKCVESASLEEQLCCVNKQLAQAQHHIQQLDSRNKQLRAHLFSEGKEDSQERSEINVGRSDNSINNCKSKLSTVRNSQLSLQN